jgi:hypothetical protein
MAENEETLFEGEKMLYGRDCGTFSGKGEIASKGSAFPTEY